MGKGLEDLELKSEALPTVAPDAIPDEFGPPSTLFYPGAYRFKLPADLTHLWEKVEVTVNDQGVADAAGTKKGERVQIEFTSADPLIIEQSLDPDVIGQAFTCRISNVERNRARKGEPKVYVSDMTYLLRALGSKNPAPKSNLEFVKELCALAGRSFGATLEYSTYCNKTRDAQQAVFGEDGTMTLVQLTNTEGAPVQGCGKRYYMSDWPKNEDGVYLDRRTCECGASLRAFNQVRSFTA